MMRRISLILALALLAPICFMTGGAPSIENGKNEYIASLNSPDFGTTVDLTFPVDYYVANATMSINGLSVEGNASAYPENVTVRLNDTLIWEYLETGFGPLGKQDGFSTGQEQLRLPFGQGGGSLEARIRLPKNAVVQRAMLDLEGSGPLQSQELLNFPGNQSSGITYLGFSVSDVGDVNNDGFDDVIAGTTYGEAYLYIGGQKMDGGFDLLIPAYHPWLGTPASGAGDVNADGFDDIIVANVFNDTSGQWKGRAYILFGGNFLDNAIDVPLIGFNSEHDDATSVSTAGDVNGDGYDDVIWGTDESYMTNPGTGHAYLHFGGQKINSTPDLTFAAGDIGDCFGCVISDAGDVNNDGYDDLIVGAHDNATKGCETGRAYIFFGGKSMDTAPDVILTGAFAGDCFGYTVSDAGDVNHDEYDDVLVSAPYNDSGGTDSGVAYIFFGGQNMDNIPDVTLIGGIVGDRFGYSISDAGDMNRDGYDDVIIGTFGDEGHAYLLFGGSNMDNAPDGIYTGGALGDALGYSVSAAGDVNNDGKNDILIGAWANRTANDSHGRVYIYTMNTPIIDASVTIGSRTVWKKDGFFNGTTAAGDFSVALNDYLGSATSSAIDAFGNAYVDVPLGVKAGSEGNITLSNLSIVYQYNASVPDFAYALNSFLKDHRGKKDASGNITVPLKIRAQSAGRVQLSNLTLTRDSAPALLEELQTVEMDEDTANVTLIDLHHYFQDDVESDSTLDFSVVSATNSTMVDLRITGKRYLSVDALTGGDNDNWTGTVEATVACDDRWGQTTESNQFTIVVRNVNDPPVMIGAPSLMAEPGESYSYNVTAIDGDKDSLHYFLTNAPPGMTIRPLEGAIKWLPRARGTFGFNVSVDDGNATSERNFTITVPNRPPILTSTPPLNATAGVTYAYNVTAADSNLDIMDISLHEAPEGMDIKPMTGEISWTPQEAGDYNISIRVSDNESEAFQNFTIRVAPPDQPPSNNTIIPSPGRPKRDSGWSSGLEMEITASAALVLVAIGIAFSAGTEAGKYRLTLLFMPLYTRLRKEEVLDNETRGMIRGCITSEPGIHYKGILHRLKLKNGTAAYHLMTLERDGFIHSMADGRLKRFFPAGMIPAKAPPVLTRLEKIIFEALRENEGMSEMDISRALDVPYQTISRHVNKMAKMGVLRLEKRGLTVKSYIVEGIRPSGMDEGNVRGR